MKISTTIKAIYLDLIVSGEKKVEYREINDFWTKRICKIPDQIIFICGNRVERYEIVSIELVNKKIYDFDNTFWFALHLGKRLKND